MKNVIVAAVLAVAASSAFAAEANLFTCENAAEKVQVGYSSTSFVGKPQLNITIDGRDVLLGDAARPNLVSLTSDETVLGELVSAVVTRQFIADAPSLVYSVVIPGIQLGQDATEAKFDTLLIQGSTGGFMALPAVYQRINKTTKLSCKAQAVLF
jgi:hypothetical protein